MKPIKLRLKYFGPYVDETIDFREFSDAPVFLISGNTGTGKTTIFDAMCFALFGQTSGGERAAEQMRSDFANDDQLTEVNFFFEDQKKIYQITRSPKQTVSTKRGKGLTTRSAKVSLIYSNDSGDKREIDKINQANTFICDLLNLTAQQFSQIVLLPQGQFRNFLTADSNDKETVLRELFGTDFYQRFVEDIGEKAKQRRAGTQQQLIRLRSLQENAKFDDTKKPSLDEPVPDWLEELCAVISHEKAELSELTKHYQDNEHTKGKLERTYQSQQELLRDQHRLAELRQEKVKLKDEEPQIENLRKHLHDLKWADRKRAALKELTDTHNLLQELQAKQETAAVSRQSLRETLTKNEEDKKELEQTEPQIKDYQGQVERLRDKVSLYQEVELLSDKHAHLLGTAKKTRQRYIQTVADLKEIRHRQELVSEKMKQYSDLHRQGIRLQQQQDQVSELNNQMSEITEALHKQESAQNEVAEWKRQLKRSKELAHRAEEESNKLELQYYKDQIVLLAEKLEPGAPCPVCGSTEHPHPAVSTAIAEPVGKEQVKQAQEKKQAAWAAVKTKEGSIQTRTDYINQWAQEIKNQQQQLGVQLADSKAGDRESVVYAIKRAEVKLEQEQHDYRSRIKEQEKATTELADLQTQQAALDKEEKEANNNFHLANVKEQKTLIEYEQKKDLLPVDFSSSKQLKDQLARWSQQIEQHQQQKTENQDQLNEVSRNLAAVNAGIKDRTERLEETEKKHTAVSQELNQQCAAYKKGMDLQQLRSLCEKQGTIKIVRDQIQEYQDKVTVNQTSQSQLIEQIAGRPEPNVTETSTKIDALEQKQNDLFQHRSSAAHKFHGNEETYHRVAEIWRQYQNALSEDQQWDQLAAVVGGKGKLKLNMERYVLQSYFTEVLEVANQRFAELTSGRYSFCLDEDTGSYASNTGLELNVYDDNAGKIRSVHTLSGGESFIAALCLALALGEVVSAQAGGVNVEALFIDEGFGSLDTDSLQMALDALRAIEGKNRLIGIISHVSELQAEIPDQLHVVSNNGRSHIEYKHEFEQ